MAASVTSNPAPARTYFVVEIDREAIDYNNRNKHVEIKPEIIIRFQHSSRDRCVVELEKILSEIESVDHELKYRSSSHVEVHYCPKGWIARSYTLIKTFSVVEYCYP
jgi:hypothetical protein